MFTAVDHSLVLTDRNEGSAQTAHVGRCHHAAFLHLIVEKSQRRCCPGPSNTFQADLLQDFRHAVSHRGSGRQGQIDDPKRNSQLFGSLLGHQLSHRVTLNAVFLMVSQRASKLWPLTSSIAVFTTPGPLTPHIDHRVRLGHTMERSRHKRIVVGSVAEDHQLGASQRIPFLRGFRRLFDDGAISLTASILMPVFVEPTLTELHTRSVDASASGMERIRSSSAGVIPLLTRAE